MTEAEWQACADPQEMLDSLPDGISDRKLRLFACACCRRVWHLLPDERSRRAVEFAERYADGKVSRGAWLAMVDEAMQAHTAASGAVHHSSWAAYLSLDPDIEDSVAWIAGAAVEAVVGGLGNADRERRGQAGLLRDILGDPFRPATTDLSHLGSGVLNLARDIYKNRTFGRLPALADAIREAGCDHTDLLAHCGGPEQHVRGCWAVDLVLGQD